MQLLPTKALHPDMCTDDQQPLFYYELKTFLKIRRIWTERRLRLIKTCDAMPGKSSYGTNLALSLHQKHDTMTTAVEMTLSNLSA